MFRKSLINRANWVSFLSAMLILMGIISLVLTLFLGFCGFINAMAISFIIFLLTACTIIGLTIILSIYNVFKKIKDKGFKAAIKPLLQDFILYSLVFCIGYRVVEKEWSIYPLGASVLFAVAFQEKNLIIRRKK